MFHRRAWTLVAAALVATLLSPASFATIQHVKPGGAITLPPYDCWDNAASTIQQGLNACADGDTVLVKSGTYTETLVWPGVAGIVLLSVDGADATIIDASSAAGTGSVISLTAVPGAQIGERERGFTIRGGQAGSGGGISAVNSAVRITGNKIIQNNAASGGGVFGYGPGTSLLLNYNLITGNLATQLGAGVSVQEGASITADHNVVRQNMNPTYEGGGFFL